MAFATDVPAGSPIRGFDDNLDACADGVDLNKMYNNFGTIWRF